MQQPNCGRLGPNNTSRKNKKNVNIKLAPAILGAALILAGSPAFAADVQSGPIHINNVSIYGGNTPDANADNIITPGSTAINFTNQYKFAATNVVFALETNGYVLDRFNDVGSFATGVTINHTFAENELNSEMRVAVEKATFADGTTWVNPAVPQSTQPDTTVGVAVSGSF
jgi:hypothetical protein